MQVLIPILFEIQSAIARVGIIRTICFGLNRTTFIRIISIWEYLHKKEMMFSGLIYLIKGLKVVRYVKMAKPNIRNLIRNVNEL